MFWRGAGKKNRFICIPGGGSLLANSFCVAWCHALNLQADGERVDYFGMLHDDVVPQIDWADQLIDDLEEHDADVMSAVTPIKDPLGLSSTAISDPSDHLSVTRRITMTEAWGLPEVFSAEDCGYVPPHRLLINTGCWVCRFDRPWRFDSRRNPKASPDCSGAVPFTPFTIRDEVRRALMPDGKVRWVAAVEPEDWWFSRWVGEQGGKVMATRRVKLKHVGHIPYSNDEPWGQMETDLCYKHKTGGVRIPQKLPVPEGAGNQDGWLTASEGQALSRLARDGKVLEIGSYKGRSTVWMAGTAILVDAVDTFDGRGTPNPGDCLPEFKRNIIKAGMDKAVRWHQGTSAAMVPGLSDEYDMAFIDGDHAVHAVRDDARMAAEKLTRDGLLAFHDYDSPKDPGVTEAVNELLADGWEMAERVDSLAILRRKQFGGGAGTAPHEEALSVP